MKKTIIDISVPLENDVVSDPPGYEPHIEYLTHKQTTQEILNIFPGLKEEDLPEGQGWAIEWIRLMTHNGTHLDAPWHFHSTMKKGEKALTIDEVPLEWCFQRAVKLDFRHFEDGYIVTAPDIKSELKRVGCELQPLDIVLVNTCLLYTSPSPRDS